MTELNSTPQQKQFNLLLIGDNCTDVYRYGSIDRISPEAPVPIFKFSHEERRQGMAGNVRNNLSTLGCNVEYLHTESSIKTRLIDTRSKQHIVRIDEDIDCTSISLDTTNISLYDAIIISDYNKGTVSYEFVEELRKQYEGPIFVDTKKHDLARFEGCIIKINIFEFNKLTSIPSENTDLIVTHGDKGVVWNGNIIKAINVDASDVCGAGDTFLSALTYSYLKTNDMIRAIKFANRASSITVQHSGVYAPSLKEIYNAA